jgi:Na+-translocating ferredoxin:NAD+ oxidoreductase RnfG subunit
MYASVDPFIQLTAAIALLVTALLGIVGYMVQNKASITTNATQHELIQEVVERQRVEKKVGKQLDRVQLQNKLDGK